MASLLDEDDLIQEAKSGNQNLIQWMNRDRVKQLLDMILVMPEEDEHKRGHKYPFVASEVLSCDIRELFDLFFKAPCDDVIPEPETKDEDSSEGMPDLDDQ